MLSHAPVCPRFCSSIPLPSPLPRPDAGLVTCSHLTGVYTPDHCAALGSPVGQLFCRASKKDPSNATGQSSPKVAVEHCLLPMDSSAPVTLCHPGCLPRTCSQPCPCSRPARASCCGTHLEAPVLCPLLRPTQSPGGPGSRPPLAGPSPAPGCQGPPASRAQLLPAPGGGAQRGPCHGSSN